MKGSKLMVILLLALSAQVSLREGYAQNSSPTRAADKTVPLVFTVNGAGLAALKEDVARHPAKYAAVVKQLKEEAGTLLSQKPYTITSKESLPPSGDPHDYESQGPYWWPNPKTKDGLPYIRRDGEVNPEIRKLKDHQYLSEMRQAVRTLSLAYYLLGDEAYAEKARLFLRTWFVEPATRMNPNLNYGQRIPGRTDGRGIGIIETRQLGEIADAVGLIRTSKAWTRADQKAMEQWMASYLDWLINSANGKDEADEHNNHGTWYDVQVAALALFTGRGDIARQAIIRTRDERLPKHIEPDGRQPFELARTRSWSYSVMNLQGFFTLATLAEKTNIDLWHYTTPDGRSMKKALDYLINFIDDSNPWPYKQITQRKPLELVPLLLQAACRFPNESYGALADKLAGGEEDVNNLFYFCNRH